MEPNKKKDLNEKLLDGQASFTSYSSKPKEKGTYSFNRCCSKMNNQTVLFIVCCLFACFATSEMIGALVRYNKMILNYVNLIHLSYTLHRQRDHCVYWEMLQLPVLMLSR